MNSRASDRLVVVLSWSSVPRVTPSRSCREYERLVVFRLGRVLGTKGPGLVILIPLVDRAVRWTSASSTWRSRTRIGHHRGQRVDLDRLHRVQQGHGPADVGPAPSGTSPGAAQNIAATTLRSVVGDMSLDDVLAKRERDERDPARTKLDEVTERWGVKVTNVEIREIIPPPAVQEAMTRQMSAERTRRAVVTEAEGAKQAAITVAEGNKDAAILNAEGQKQAAILNAEGDRQAAILRAEGFSLALDKINEVANVVADEHDEPAVPRGAEADRLVVLVQVRRADGARRARGRRRRPRRAARGQQREGDGLRDG